MVGGSVTDAHFRSLSHNWPLKTASRMVYLSGMYNIVLYYIPAAAHTECGTPPIHVMVGGI